MTTVPVKFLRHFDRYNPREVAGFGADLARQLVDRGLARPFDPNEPADGDEIAGGAEAEAGALAQREAEIAAREAAMAEREAALAALADGAPKKPGKAAQD